MKNKAPLTPVLVNAEEMNRQHPDTFHLPDARDSIPVGGYAKICCNDERFWTKIVAADSGVYTGSVENNLVMPENKELKHGSLVQFAACNVYAISEGEESPPLAIPHGSYWICDPSYAWPDNVGEKFMRPLWEQMKNGLPKMIQVDGVPVFMWFAADGDGLYPVFDDGDDAKGTIGVDSGVVALIPRKLIIKWKTERKLKDMQKDGLAVMVKLEGDEDISYDDGDVFFGEYQVATNLNPEGE